MTVLLVHTERVSFVHVILGASGRSFRAQCVELMAQKSIIQRLFATDECKGCTPVHLGHRLLASVDISSLRPCSIRPHNERATLVSSKGPKYDKSLNTTGLECFTRVAVRNFAGGLIILVQSVAVDRSFSRKIFAEGLAT